MKVTFICGCQTNEIIDRKNVETMDMVDFDDEGFIICAIHKQRRYGWRSIPNRPGLKLNDWSFKSWTPLEIEHFLVFGEQQPPKIIHHASEIEMNMVREDRRDNRDSESLVVRVAALDRFGSLIVSSGERPIFIYPRDDEASERENLLASSEEIHRQGRRSQVLPWPEHQRLTK